MLCTRGNFNNHLGVPLTGGPAQAGTPPSRACHSPVIHASTVLYPTAADFLARRGRYQYGRRGTPTSEL